MFIPDDQIERVRASANLVDVVSAHVALKRRGQNHLGLCPFHSEKTPSFSVSESKQIFHCFGCGEGGDVFAFVMRTEGLDFADAVRRLAERYGVALAPVQAAGGERHRGDRDRVRRANDLALVFFRERLAQSGADSPVARYLATRGLDAAAVDRFELGYAPDEWTALTAHLARAGVPREDLALAGLAIRREGRDGAYDRFRGRLIFPIRAGAGDVAGFGGRVIGEGEPKYLNSPETPLYHKGSVLYGLHLGRPDIARGGRVLVVEGYLDVIACHRHGLTFAVAPLGTALTAEHAKLLARHAERVDLVFDGDSAGQNAALKAAAVLAPFSLEVRIATLPAGEDPDSLLATGGAEALEAHLAAGRPMVDWLLEACLGNLDGAPVERRLKAAGPVLEVLGRMTDPLRKGHYLGVLAQRLGVDEAALRRQVARDAARGTAPAEKSAASRGAAPPPPAEDLLLHLVAQGAVGADWLADRVGAEAFTDPRARAVAEALVALARDGGPAGAFSERLADRLRDHPEALALASGWLTREAPVEGDPMGLAADCAAALARRETREVGRRLLADIRAAEAKGDTARVVALLKAKDAMHRAGRGVAAL
jgi:DNA primase